MRFIWALLEKKELRVSKEIAMERFDICNGCEKINRKGLIAKLKGPRCGICGCVLAYKVGLSFESCPDTPPKWLSKD